MVFDSREQRRIMGRFATGVTVASTRVGDQTWGMTANAVTSLSLNPPLVLLCVGREGQSCAMFRQAGCFALNILRADQEDLSNRFAFAGPKDFSGLSTAVASTGAPILDGALGWLDCKVVQILPGGDHEIFVGEIQAGGVGEGQPLLYYGGKYSRLEQVGI
jgi:flavin reductase (DIM6/NTAB) family NADH-FMN oxidoreductase RutF